MTKRVLVFLVAVVGAITFFASGASAQYASPTTLTQTGGGPCVPGEVAAFTVTGAAPGSEVTFIFESDPVVLGVATADADGVAVLDTRWPTTATDGAHTVRAQGVDADGAPFDLTFGADCSVATAPAGALPTTGTDSLPWLRVAVVLVAAGGLALLASRKRAAVVAEGPTQRV